VSSRKSLDVRQSVERTAAVVAELGAAGQRVVTLICERPRSFEGACEWGWTQLSAFNLVVPQPPTTIWVVNGGRIPF
jgi:hypothetical protein